MTLGTCHRAIVTVLTGAAIATLTACGNKSVEEVDSEAVVSVKTAVATVGAIRGVVHATATVTPAPGAELVVVAPEPARIAELPHAGGRPRAARRSAGALRESRIRRPKCSASKPKSPAHRRRSTTHGERSSERVSCSIAASPHARKSRTPIALWPTPKRRSRRRGPRWSRRRRLRDGRVVRATFDGIVATRLHNPGDLVEATASDPVLRVIDPRRLEVVAAVPLADAPRVEVGATAHLAAAPTTTAPQVDLKVVSRPAAVEAGTATVPVRLAFTTTASFPAGTPVEVDIDAEQHTNVVLVPAVSVVRDGEETAVFVAAARRRSDAPCASG